MKASASIARHFGRGSLAARVDYTPPWALSRCSFWNAVVAEQAQKGTIDTEAARATRAAMWSAIDRYRAEVPTGTSFGCEELAAPNPYEGRVVALVDKRTSSSGESSAVQLADAMGAAIIGERTDGAVEYGNVRSYLLPRSGTLVQFGGKHAASREPREGVGLPIDLYLDDVSAPVESILASLGPWLARTAQGSLGGTASPAPNGKR